MKGQSLMQKQKQVDMIHEKPLTALFRFAVPLLFGNLLQQLYNMADSVVVGNLIGSDALAAVGTSGPLIQLMLGFFMGLSASVSILTAHAVGKQDHSRMERLMHTALLMGLGSGVVIGVVGIVISPTLLRLMNTPAEVYGMACDYMTIIMGGMATSLLFNVINGVLQGVGDTKTPLLILLICSVVNVVLDLLFVAAFHMTADGVAWATVIAQALSVAFGLGCIRRAGLMQSLRPSRMRFSLPEMKEILRLGFPAGLQNALDSIGNLLVQGVLNGFGAVAIAANLAVIKVDSFCTMPMMTFASATTVFVGQNLGARQPKRVRQAVRLSLLATLAMAAVISLLLVTCGPAMLGLFTQDQAVVEAGMDKIRILAPLYACMGIWVVLAGAVRGSGKTLPPMLIGVLGMFLVRVPIATFLSRSIGVNGVHWSLGVVWAVQSLSIALYLLWQKKKGAAGAET